MLSTLVIKRKNGQTFKKYRLGVPSGRIADTHPVIVHAELPYGSAEITLVPFGITDKINQHCFGKFSFSDLPSITALSIGKRP